MCFLSVGRRGAIVVFWCTDGACELSLAKFFALIICWGHRNILLMWDFLLLGLLGLVFVRDGNGVGGVDDGLLRDGEGSL